MIKLNELLLCLNKEPIKYIVLMGDPIKTRPYTEQLNIKFYKSFADVYRNHLSCENIVQNISIDSNDYLAITVTGNI